jgi:hypothetical protein
MAKAKVISTKIRINNSNNITYVLKKYNNNTYKIFTYQKNMSQGCYYLVGPPQTGICNK